MKKTILIPLVAIAALLIVGLLWQSNRTTADSVATAPAPNETPAPTIAANKVSTGIPAAKSNAGDAIQWVSWDEAVKAHTQAPKMLFIDVYTDWCGWCKVMDKQTFTDPQVIKHINDNYYAVKFNAETEAPVMFRGQEFKVVEGGRRGIHTLAYALLEGQLSYPSYVYLNADLQRVNVSKGFKPAEPFLAELQAVTKAYVQ